MINSNLHVTSTTGNLQNLVFILTSPQNVTPKVVPNILSRNRPVQHIIQVPKIPSKPPQTWNPVQIPKADIPTIVIDSDSEDSQPYILNQDEIAALDLQSTDNSGGKPIVKEILVTKDQVHVLNQQSRLSDLATLPLKSTESTDNSKTNSQVKEIFVTKDQVHLLKPTTVPPDKPRESICRTCLSSTPTETCSKLFDTVDKDKSENLRRKITYTAGDIDFCASYEPVICSNCVSLIDTAYKFKRKVTEIESRINEKRCAGGIKTMVSLRSVKSTPARNDKVSKENKPKIWVNMNIQNSTKEKVTSEGNAENNVGNSNDMSLQGSNTVDDYLTKRENFLCKVLSEDIPKEAPKEVPVKKPQGKPRRPYFGSFDIDPVTGKPSYPVRVIDMPTPRRNNTNNTLKLNTKDTGRTYSKKTFGVDKLETKISAGNLFSNVKLKVKKGDIMYGRKWLVLDENAKVMKRDKYKSSASPANIQTYQFTSDMAEEPKSSERPLVPKTLDIFDAEHDRYFRIRHGLAGRMLIRKWRKFARNTLLLGPGPYLCHLCGFQTTIRPKFKAHENIHLPKTKMCSYCGKMCSSMVVLQEHVRSKHKPPTQQCTYCGKMFHLSSLLSAHVSAVHTQNKQRFQCHHCGKVLSYGTFKMHMEKHSSTTFTCDLCQKEFSTRLNLQKHKRGHGHGYRCKFCPNRFTSDSSMRHHMQYIHKGMRYKCLICGKLLARKENVVRHYNVVHGEVPQRKNLKEDSGEDSDYQDAVEIVYESDPSSAKELYENFSNVVNQNLPSAVEDSSKKVNGNITEENEKFNNEVTKNLETTAENSGGNGDEYIEEEIMDENYDGDMEQNENVNSERDNLVTAEDSNDKGDENILEETADENFNEDMEENEEYLETAVQDFGDKTDENLERENLNGRVYENTIEEEVVDQNYDEDMEENENFNGEEDNLVVAEDSNDKRDENVLEETADENFDEDMEENEEFYLETAPQDFGDKTDENLERENLDGRGYENTIEEEIIDENYYEDMEENKRFNGEEDNLVTAEDSNDKRDENVLEETADENFDEDMEEHEEFYLETAVQDLGDKTDEVIEEMVDENIENVVEEVTDNFNEQLETNEVNEEVIEYSQEEFWNSF